MNSRKHMIIVKGEIKTAQIRFCEYNYATKKWDVEFNSGKIFSYSYLNVQWLKNPLVLNPNMYKISRNGREFYSIQAIYVFKSEDNAYWHICFENGREGDYLQEELKIIESCLDQKQVQSVFEYIKQIASLSEVKNEKTGEKILAQRFESINFVGRDVALAKYLNPSLFDSQVTKQEYIPIFPFGCNNSQYKAVKSAMENQISVIQGPPGTGKTKA